MQLFSGTIQTLRRTNTADTRGVVLRSLIFSKFVRVRHVPFAIRATHRLLCLRGAAEALANELAPRRINCVSPGVIDTPMFSKFGAAKDERLAAMTAGNPIARPGAADEVAAAVVFALENAYMTGAVLEVDGGLVVAPPK